MPELSTNQRRRPATARAAIVSCHVPRWSWHGFSIFHSKPRCLLVRMSGQFTRPLLNA